MNYRKLLLLLLEIKIDRYLNEIEVYTDSAYDYMYNPDNELDKDEILMDLSTIPELIKETKSLITKLEQEYENEQLQQAS